MINVELHPALEKDLKRLPKQFADYIIDTIVEKLEHGQLAVTPLKGTLKGLQKIRLRHQGISYRMIVYPIRPRTLQVVMVGKRGEFYDRLERRLR